MRKLKELSLRIARLERWASEKSNIKPEDVFFDNPLKKSVKDFAESKAVSNDPSVAAKSKTCETPKKEVKKSLVAPPTPSEIKEDAGGDSFSTLTQLVVNTEEKVKGVPKNFNEAPKVNPREALPESQKTKRELKQEAIKKVMNRKLAGYDITNY
jgi:hypothetical protein